MKFSERIGKTPITNILERENISGELNNRLWNCLGIIIDDLIKSEIIILEEIWDGYFKSQLSLIPVHTGGRNYFILKAIKKMEFMYSERTWYEQFDFIEFILKIEFVQIRCEYRTGIIKKINKILQEEKSAYRIIDGKVMEINNEEEQVEINKTLEISDRFSRTKEHLKKSLTLYSNRENLDYANAIKESMHAVETVAKVILVDEKSSLGTLMAKIETDYNMPSTLKEACLKLYGYTSQEGGIRHALPENNRRVTSADARFMIVICSALVNYLIETCEVKT